MRNTLRYSAILMCIILGLLTTGKAQRAINAAGNTLKSDSVSYAYSVGEITAFPLNEHCLYTPGVIQPAIYNIEKPVVNAFGQYHEMVLYPNPVHDMVTIETSYPNLSYYQVVSIDGKIVEKDKYKYIPLHLGRLQPGLYLITLFSADFRVKQSFKIIKQ